MATTTAPTRRTRFSRRIPDHVTDELVQVLQLPQAFEFNDLFKLVYENLKKRNAVSGGEEMLRLRAYEKLQNLVGRSMVAKVNRTYRGLETLKNAIIPMPPRPTVVPVVAAAASLVEAPVEENNRISVVSVEAKPSLTIVPEETKVVKAAPLKASVAKVSAPAPKAKAVAPKAAAPKAKALPKAATVAKAASAKAKPAKAKVAAKTPAKRVPAKAKK